MRSITLFILTAVFVITSTYAQDFQGTATYKSHRKVEVQLDSSQMGSEMHEKMMEMLKKQFEKTYTLNFSKEESLYKEEEQLESPQPAGMQIVMVDAGGSDILYKNTKEQRYTNQNEVFGKVFLIKDKMEAQDWELSSETKNIGDYTCYKATRTIEVESRESGVSVNGDKELSDEVKMEERTITAWVHATDSC